MKTLAHDFHIPEETLTARLTQLHGDYERWQQQYGLLDYSASYRQAEAIHRLLRDLVNTVSQTPGLTVDYLDPQLSRLGGVLRNVQDRFEDMRQPGGRPANFPRKRLVSRLVQLYATHSSDKQTQIRTTDFVVAVFDLWGLPADGLDNTVAEVRKTTP